MRFFLPIVLAAVPVSSLLAQTPTATLAPDSARQLSEVTVYATRLGQVAGQTGRYVTVVLGAALTRYPVTSLDDLLRLLPAIEVQSRGSFGAQADISLRGSTFNQVLLLLDGMRLNDPLTGHFAGYFPITPAEIEQIEIVRGPGAALYGPDAVGGFINIVTKTFAATHRPDEAELQGSFLAGQWNLKSTNAGFYGQQRGLRLAGGVLNNTTDGQERPAPSTLRNDVAATTYSLSAAYDLTDKLSAAARASFDQRDFNAQYFYTTNPTDQAREQTTRDWYQGQLRYQWNARARTELQAVGTASTDVYRFTPASVASDHLMHYLNFQGQHQVTISENVRATLGGQADRRTIASNDRGHHDTWHVGAFGVVAATLPTATALTGALRLDHDRAYGTELVPQLNASQPLGERLTVRAAVGKAIRAADFTERYTSNARPGVVPTGFNVGNPALAAERTFNYEAGADYMPWQFLTLRSTYFRRRGRNLIDYVSQPGTQVIDATGLTNLNPNATYRFAQNLFAVTTQGLETEVTVQKELSPALRLDGTVGYTWLRVRNEQGIVSQYLANSARHLVSGTASLTHRRFGLTVGGLFKQRDAQAAEAISRTLNASYAVFNVRAEAALLPERLWLTAQAQNLFDTRYADLLGAQMPGRWLMAGARVRLRK